MACAVICIHVLHHSRHQDAILHVQAGDELLVAFPVVAISAQGKIPIGKLLCQKCERFDQEGKLFVMIVKTPHSQNGFLFRCFPRRIISAARLVPKRSIPPRASNKAHTTRPICIKCFSRGPKRDVKGMNVYVASFHPSWMLYILDGRTPATRFGKAEEVLL